MEKWECSVVMAALQTDCVPLHIKTNCRIQCQDKENQIFALLWDNVVTMFYWKEQSFSSWTSPLAAASFSIPNTFSPLKLWGNLATLLVKSNTGELTLLWGQEVTPAASQPVQQMFFPKKGMLCSFLQHSDVSKILYIECCSFCAEDLALDIYSCSYMEWLSPSFTQKNMDH